MRAQNMVCRLAGGAWWRHHRNQLPPHEPRFARHLTTFPPLPFRRGEGRGEGSVCAGPFRGNQTARSGGTGKKCTRALLPLFVATLCLVLGLPSIAQVVNGGFETGGFEAWTADPNWVVVDNSCGFYSGWAGKYWAWSGGKGESATGVLTSKPFKLDKDAVRLLISGWSSIRGTGQPRRWNYVTLNLADGTELDRVYAPDTTAFVPVVLDGSKHRGKTVFIRAVDDSDQPTFSMLCIDDVRTVDRKSVV